MDHIVVDVEIQKTIEETPGGWEATDALGVSCACVWEFSQSRMRVYGSEDVVRLQNRLYRADRITGFNILNFDYPVIWGISKEDWRNGHAVRSRLLPKTDDILRRVWRAKELDPDKYESSTHGEYGLDRIATDTIGRGKIGNGADAPRWYQEGQIQRVVNYCADDVALTRDLLNFLEEYGYVLRLEGGHWEKIKVPRWGRGF